MDHDLEVPPAPGRGGHHMYPAIRDTAATTTTTAAAITIYTIDITMDTVTTATTSAAAADGRW